MLEAFFSKLPQALIKKNILFIAIILVLYVHMKKSLHVGNGLVWCSSHALHPAPLLPVGRRAGQPRRLYGHRRRLQEPPAREGGHGARQEGL